MDMEEKNKHIISCAFCVHYAECISGHEWMNAEDCEDYAEECDNYEEEDEP